MILADRAEFVLGEDAWNELVRALDHPATGNPALARPMRRTRPEQVPRFAEPEPLGPRHDTAGFDCGVESLTVWLTEHAQQARDRLSAAVEDATS